MSIVTYANGTIDRNAALRSYVHTVTAGQDSANAAAINMGLGTTATVVPVSVQIESTGNVYRAPQGAVTVSAGVITVNDSGLAVDEKIHILAVGYAA